MQQDKLQNILKELYELDPSLRQYGDKLNVLLQKMLESEPNTEPDARFVAKLRHKLISYKPKQSFSLNIFHMNKTPFVVVGMVMTLAIVTVASVSLVGVPTKKQLIETMPNNFFGVAGAPQTFELAANAFGRLGLSGQNAPNKAPMPSANVLGSESAKSSIDTMMPEVGFGGGGGAATSPGATKMMADTSGMPYYDYQYNLVYVGDDFKITDQQMPVYRLDTDVNIAKAIAGSILNTGLGFINLAKFSGASVGNVSLSQGQGGYNIYLNFDQGRVSLDKNQSYPGVYYAKPMMICDGPNCATSIYPENTYKQASDVELIGAANKFLDEYGIDKSVYGQPVVENDSVIYPIMFDDKISYDSGNYLNGMRVYVNSGDMSVQSVNEIINPIFEKSNYDLETDFAIILKVAQNGGMNGIFYGATQTDEILNLGTPKYVYLHQYDYSANDGRARELYIPALYFPIINIPKDRYFYQTSIIVPIVKDFLDNYVNGGIGVPVPMPYVTSSSVEPGGSGSVDGSVGSGIDYPEALIKF